MRKTRLGDLEVRCPLCQAAAGSECKSTGGHGPIRGQVHRERRQAAQEATQAVRDGV